MTHQLTPEEYNSLEKDASSIISGKVLSVASDNTPHNHQLVAVIKFGDEKILAKSSKAYDLEGTVTAHALLSEAKESGSNVWLYGYTCPDNWGNDTFWIKSLEYQGYLVSLDYSGNPFIEHSQEAEK